MNSNELTFLGSLRKIGFARANELLSFALAYEGAETSVIDEVKAPRKQNVAQPIPEIPAEVDAQLIALCSPKKSGCFGKTNNNSLSGKLRALYQEKPTALDLSPKWLKEYYEHDYSFLKNMSPALIYSVKNKLGASR